MRLAPLPSAYAGTPSEAVLKAFGSGQGTQRGDPAKAAKILANVLEGKTVLGGEGKQQGAVKRLLLGPDAVERAERSVGGLWQGVLAGKRVAIGTDRDDL
jgi:hypothetical protein